LRNSCASCCLPVVSKTAGRSRQRHVELARLKKCGSGCWKPQRAHQAAGQTETDKVRAPTLLRRAMTLFSDASALPPLGRRQRARESAESVKDADSRLTSRSVS
jgi:hypothetical protein